jgi:hypothetical protein
MQMVTEPTLMLMDVNEILMFEKRCDSQMKESTVIRQISNSGTYMTQDIGESLRKHGKVCEAKKLATLDRPSGSYLKTFKTVLRRLNSRCLFSEKLRISLIGQD